LEVALGVEEEPLLPGQGGLALNAQMWDFWEWIRVKGHPASDTVFFGAILTRE
jgi:hypothetical protein